MTNMLSAEDLQIVNRVEAGFAGLGAHEDACRAAVASFRRWLVEPALASYVPMLKMLAQEKKFGLLLNSFHQVLPFGTGGRRGPVGFGPNCFNPWTLMTTVEAHVGFLTERFRVPATALRVVLAFDVRVFRDIRGVYSDLSNPLLGMRSSDFACLAAEVYAAHGVETLMPSPHSGIFLSTPELSFAIRRARAHGGLNVSASHNHPDDNGGKFYNERGGQEVPPNDEIFARLVDQVTAVRRMPFADALLAEKIRWLDYPDLHAAYLESALACCDRVSDHGNGVRAARDRVTVAFSNLNGTGDTNVGEAIAAAGHTVLYVEEQRPHDGTFPHVPFRAPNPEVPESLTKVIGLAKVASADIAFVTDPDADRLGLAVPDAHGAWHVLTGNEIGALLVSHRCRTLSEQKRLNERSFLVKTIVTSSLIEKIARSWGVTVFGDFLVGFKYIGDCLRKLEEDGRFRGHSASPSDLVAGIEESHGYLLAPCVRDKDAAQAAVLLADMAAQAKREGQSLFEALQATYGAFGVHTTLQYPIVVTGADGMAAIASIQKALRCIDVGTAIGSTLVVSKDDYWDETQFGPFLSTTDRQARNIVRFRFSDGSTVLVRPSGTEPKIKLYFETVATTDVDLMSQQGKATRAARELRNWFALRAYASIGVHLPHYALELSPLMDLQNKVHFVNAVMPIICSRANELDAGLLALIDSMAERYGANPLQQVRPAIRAALEGDWATIGFAESGASFLAGLLAREASD